MKLQCQTARNIALRLAVFAAMLGITNYALNGDPAEPPVSPSEDAESIRQ